MTVIYRKKKKFCEVRGYGADSPILVPYWGIRREEKPRETYDSSIEEKVYNSLRIPVTRNGWKILRESDIVILPKSKKIMIPDFTIKSDSSKVFIEVIGYWREKYLRKKREKLIEIANENLSNFIFLVNEKNRKSSLEDDWLSKMLIIRFYFTNSTSILLSNCLDNLSI